MRLFFVLGTEIYRKNGATMMSDTKQTNYDKENTVHIKINDPAKSAKKKSCCSS